MASLVESDWPNAARQLKELADAESTLRPTLSEYPDRTNVAKIPLLALDCSTEHEPAAGRPFGIWSLNHGFVDRFASDYLAIAAGLGKSLPDRPEGIDPLTFLLHRLSVWLWRQQQPGTGFTGFKFLYLLERPLPNGRSIQIRHIASLVRATELHTRYQGTFGRELNEDPAYPWLKILPGSPDYPRMIDRPDGPRGRVETREEHARLFTAGWIGRNRVTVHVPTTPGGEPGGLCKEIGIAQTPEVPRETKPNPETPAAVVSKPPANTDGVKGLKSIPLESEADGPSGGPVPTPTASNIDKTRGIDPTAEDEDWVVADRAVERHLEVSVRIAARWLRCTDRHIRRLARNRALTASNTRPKRITTKSLREYKWPQDKPNAPEDN
jgi:hypothetical protein